MNNMTEQGVCDLLREKSLLTEKGISLVLNGDFVSLNVTAITAIVNAALASQASKGTRVPVLFQSDIPMTELSVQRVHEALAYVLGREAKADDTLRELLWSVQNEFAKLQQAAQAQPVADPMDWPLPCDVTVGNGTHKKGVPLRSLVARMNVLHGMAKSQPVADAVMARRLALAEEALIKNGFITVDGVWTIPPENIVYFARANSSNPWQEISAKEYRETQNTRLVWEGELRILYAPAASIRALAAKPAEDK